MLHGSYRSADANINIELVPRLRDYINCFNIVCGARKFFSFEEHDLVPTLEDVEAAKYYALDPAAWKSFSCPFEPANLAAREGSMFLLKSLYPTNCQTSNNLTAKGLFDLVLTHSRYKWGLLSKMEIRNDRARLMPVYFEFVRRFTNNFATLTMDFVIEQIIVHSEAATGQRNKVWKALFPRVSAVAKAGWVAALRAFGTKPRNWWKLSYDDMVALEDMVKDFSVAKAADFPKHREKEKKKPAPKRKAGTQKAGKGKDKKAKKVEVPAEREVIVIDDDAPDDYVVIDGTIVFID
jgi:hypothetical protein